MSQTSIIELKQADGLKIQPGEFRTILKDPVYVFDGDQIRVSKVFIDTEKSTDGIIDIPHDIDVTVKQHISCVNNELGKFVIGGNPQVPPAAPTQAPLDNIDYWLCDVVKSTETGQESNAIIVSEVRCSVIKQPGTPDPSAMPTGFPGTSESVKFMYVDMADQLRIVYIPLPFKKRDGTTSFFGDRNVDPIIVPTNIIAKQNGLTLPATDPIPKQLAKFNLKGLETTFALVRDDDNRARVAANHIPDFLLNAECDAKSGPIRMGFYYFTKPLTNNNGDIMFIQPKLFTKTFTINEGKYLPQDLCDIITNEYSRNEATNKFTNNEIVQSQFLDLTTNYSIQPSPTTGVFKDEPPGGGVGPKFEPGTGTLTGKSKNKFISNLGSQGYSPLAPGDDNILVYDAMPGFFIGSETVELSYNLATSKFYWNYLHFPIYSSDGFISTQRIIIDNGANPASAISSIMTRNGCIGFAELSAVKTGTETATSPGEFYDFWQGDLGFDPARIICSNGADSTLTEQTTVLHITTLICNNGLQTTAAANDLDANVTKKSTSAQPNLFMRQPLQPAKVGDPFPSVQSNLNTIIEANEIIVKQQNELSTPYFLVDLRAGFQTELHSTDRISTSIQAVVNRYYSKGSFTASEDNSFIYLHKGVPLVLTSFHVRFLDPDKTVSNELGDSNTIFVEVVRESDLARFQRQSATAQMNQIKEKEEIQAAKQEAKS